MDKRDKLRERAWVEDLEHEHWLDVEDELEAEVNYWWKKTRQGPHDDCDCHGWYVMSLYTAIRKLRSWRTG